jgi:hypothetical protein
MKDRLLAHRLLALFGAGLLLFDFPLLRLWLADGTLLGLPRLPVALFTAWAILIAGVAWLMESRARAFEDPRAEP